MSTVLDDLRTALVHGPAVLLVRHAERGHISDPRSGNDVPLTAEGERAARRLGELCGALIGTADGVVLAHSPVPRCRQTVLALREGLTNFVKQVEVIGELGHLGGPYLKDPSAALEVAAKLGSSFVREWFSGGVTPTLVEPLHVAAQFQAWSAFSVLNHPMRPRLVVLVSHDWNLMLVREHYLGVRHEDAGWIDFLDGVVLHDSSDGARVSYRGRSALLD